MRTLRSTTHCHSIGNASAFPNATFILGPGSRSLLDAGYPTTPSSDILSSAVPPDRTRILRPEDFPTAVGPFPRAHDFFGDGSFYVLDCPGVSLSFLSCPKYASFTMYPS